MSFNPSLAPWRGKTAWLVGASSGIGRATAHALHAQGVKVFVSARNAGALDAFVAEHPGATALPLDAATPGALAEAFSAVQASGPLDVVMYCAGYYAPQRATAFNLAEMLKHSQVNYVGALYLLDAVLPHFLANKSGHISLVSSVAGYRGLPNSLAYGPTKAALINLAETLYVDLQEAGVGVSVVCPGFVETPLTAQNKFTMPSIITPDQAAQEILKGWEHGQFEIHFPKRFTLLMKALSALPRSLYFPVIRRFTGL
jgi:short-subunit dehydrogenase